MKYFLYTFIFINFISNWGNAQTDGNPAAGNYLNNAHQDTSGFNLLLARSNLISFNNPDSGMMLAKVALDLAKRINYRKGEVSALITYAEAFHFSGDYPESLKLLFNALELNKDLKDPDNESAILSLIGMQYSELGLYRQALDYFFSSIQQIQHLNGKYLGSFELANIGQVYYQLHMPDSASYYNRQAYKAYLGYPTGIHLKSFILRGMGDAFALTGVKDSAMKFYKESVDYSISLNDKLNLSMTQNKIAQMFFSEHQFDSAICYAGISLKNAQSIGSKKHALESANLLTELYNVQHNSDSAFLYLKIATTTKDGYYGPEKIKQLQLLMLEQQEKQSKAERENEQYRNKIRYIALLSGVFILLLITFLLWRNNKFKKKSNLLLQQEKQSVEKAYYELKVTQAQLIQSEKMASLGELTAGIAHEIQNPLNFVNNFSEVNGELIDEMQQEMDKGNLVDAKGISNDIKENEHKIKYHGKRAADIVKGMLQHTQTSTGQKQPTDINKLADEYLRLAYHGLIAKDKSFNSDFKTDFDERIGNINIISQDIGRVILNLITNAFYVVNEKSKQNISGYEPTVEVNTKKEGNKILISVKDNGNGIPEKIKDKIFQPFFTTKPTGQGTGLGLSLAYDIVKAHGGEIKVDSKEGAGSSFIITLPANNEIPLG